MFIHNVFIFEYYSEHCSKLQEINAVCKQLKYTIRELMKKDDLEVYPLYSMMPDDKQDAALKTDPEKKGMFISQ